MGRAWDAQPVAFVNLMPYGLAVRAVAEAYRESARQTVKEWESLGYDDLRIAYGLVIL